MLIQPNRDFLGDKHLKDAEAVAKLKEENAARTEAYKIPDQKLLEDKAAALGLPMQPGVFITRLQKLNPKIIILQGGVRNAVQVRYPNPNPGPDDPPTEYITGFYIDAAMPEYSAIVTDDRGKPWREIRGWRSVLTTLIRRGIITEKQCNSQFGRPETTRSVLWHKQRQAERNNGHERRS